jgi:hypothetical protein
MMRYIDDITGFLGVALFVCAVLVAALRGRYPTASRVLAFCAFGAAITSSVLLLLFALTTLFGSPSERLARFDILTRPSPFTWFCLVSAVFTFLPAQALWFSGCRSRVSVVFSVSLLLLVPMLLCLATLRSSAAPFYP